MSNGEEAQSSSRGMAEKATKKRRVRACDQCRRRKVKCDGAEVQGNRCTNCVAFKYQCTYLAGTDKRFCDVEYVQNLEVELTEARLLIRKLRAELHALRSVPQNAPQYPAHGLPPGHVSHYPGQAISSSSQPMPTLPHNIYLPPATDDLLEEDDSDDEGLVEGFRGLNVKAETHFLGRSSNLMLIRTALDLKQEFAQTSERTSPVQEQGIFSSRRQEFWDMETTLVHSDPPYKDFPEPLLMFELIDEFFLHLNVNFPLLHRPTFEAGIHAGLHRTDEGFGATVLLVCACGARFSHNTAVLPDGARNWHWAGWHWFQQVRDRRKLVPLTQASLYDLQIAALFAAFVAASPVPHAMYAIVGHGLRLAQDLGAHRRTTYPATPTVESELKKRAFWCLIALDRGMCSVLGRPCGVQDEDFDVEWPVECDDEYWVTDDPALAFKQPPGKPSTVAFFSCLLRLGRLHANALRSIYSLYATAKVRSDPGWAQQVVSELDSELNKWVDSIPDHLKWDPNQPNLLFMNQSALLYSSYYSLQIAVHRPFIPMPRKPSPLSFPSLAICTNAARSCIHVLHRHYVRLGTALFHHWHQLTLFTAAIILLLNIWGSRYTGSMVDTAREMEEVRKALGMLKALEARWNTAGRFWDILHDLATFVDVPVQSRGQVHQKRRHDDEGTTGLAPPSHAASEPRNFAGSKRAEHYQQSVLSPDGTGTSSSFSTPDFDFALPVHSDELGRMPVAEVDFSSLAAQEAWKELAGATFDGGATAGDAAQGIDPTLEAIFSGLLPSSSYEDAFAALTQTAPQYPNALFVKPASAAAPVFQPVPSASASEAPFVASQPSAWGTETGGPSWNTGQYIPGNSNL